MPNVTQLKKGSVVQFNNGLWIITKSQHFTPGNLRGFVRLTLKNILTGQTLEQKFMSNEDMEIAFTEYKDLEYSYADDTSYVFMDQTTYEQIHVGKNIISEEDSKWLIENEAYKILFHEGNAIGLEFSNNIVIEVEETEPFIKGQTAARSYKPAKLKNGISINVPPFISAGEKIRVNPSTLEYVERA